MGRWPVRVHIQIPNEGRIMKISQPDGRVTMKLSDSFDYAAKIFLALERDAILDPPKSKKIEDTFASAIYEHVRPFDPHTDQERQRFEDNWSQIDDLEKRFVKEERKIAENDLKLYEKAVKQYNDDPSPLKRPPTRRRRTPRGCHPRISRMSICYHYGAILFTALSKIPFGEEMPPEIESLCAFAVFVNFNSMKHLVDKKKFRRSLIEWGHILDTRIEHGYSAASSLRARPVAVCKRCNRLKCGKIGGRMRQRERDDGSLEWYCVECGGVETMKIKMSVTNIKKREGKVAAEVEYFPVYMDLKATFSAAMKEDVGLRQELKSEFASQEIESRKLSFHTPSGYFVQHYDPSKKGRRRRCYISKNDVIKIGVTDPAYIQDIHLFVEGRKSSKEKLEIYLRCLKRLAELKFPKEYVHEKISNDMKARYHSIEH